MECTTSSSSLVRGSSFFSLSLLLHLVIGLTVAFQLARTEPEITEYPEDYLDLGYEAFDEVPSAEPTPPLARQEPVDVEPETRAPAAEPTAHELQDESSSVTGTQEAKEAPPATPVAGGSSGTVANVPYYKIKPRYPKEALLAGIEGYVDLRIDIKADGTVENIRASGGTQADLFENEARRAVSKWKYKPFVDDQGHPTQKANHLVRVEFKLQDSETM